MGNYGGAKIKCTECKSILNLDYVDLDEHTIDAEVQHDCQACQENNELKTIPPRQFIVIGNDNV